MNQQLLATQRRIERITSRLEKGLGISGWLDIHHHFVEGFDGDHELDESGKMSVYKTTAVTTPTWEYREAKITWYLGGAVRLDDEDLEKVAIHEYVHALMAPLATLVKPKDLHGKLEELATENIARVIYAALA